MFRSLVFATFTIGMAVATPQTPATKKTVGKKTPAAAAESGTPQWRIESIVVEGNKNYSATQILQVSGLKIGQAATKPDFEKARERLIASGAFENAGYRYVPSAANTGYAATITVQEVQPVYPYQFEDLPADPKELEAALRQSDLLFGPKIPASETILKRYSAALEQYLAAKGFKDKVSARVSLENFNDLVVIFRPATGAITVAEVRFTGAVMIPAVELQRAIHGVAIGSVYQESRFRQFLEMTIRPIYEDRGRVKVAFPTVTTEKATDVKGVIVTVAVVEGDSYNLGDVNIVGAGAKVKFKTGEPFSITALQSSIDQILAQQRRQGYMKASAAVDRAFDEKKKLVNVTIRVTPGNQYTFGELEIAGLDIIGEAAMKKMWGLEVGKPFDANYPDTFLRSVREGGLFDNLGETKAVPKVDEETKTVDVTLLFRGAPAPEGQRSRRRRP
jgi:outer membrane protein insertion porin family